MPPGSARERLATDPTDSGESAADSGASHAESTADSPSASRAAPGLSVLDAWMHETRMTIQGLGGFLAQEAGATGPRPNWLGAFITCAYEAATKVNMHVTV